MRYEHDTQFLNTVFNLQNEKTVKMLTITDNNNYSQYYLSTKLMMYMYC